MCFTLKLPRNLAVIFHELLGGFHTPSHPPRVHRTKQSSHCPQEQAPCSHMSHVRRSAVVQVKLEHQEMVVRPGTHPGTETAWQVLTGDLWRRCCLLRSCTWYPTRPTPGLSHKQVPVEGKVIPIAAHGPGPTSHREIDHAGPTGPSLTS